MGDLEDVSAMARHRGAGSGVQLCVQTELGLMVGGHLGREMIPKAENLRTQGEELDWG